MTIEIKRVKNQKTKRQVFEKKKPYKAMDWTAGVGGGGELPLMAYREAPPESVPFFILQVYVGVGISLVEVYERVEKSVISACKIT